MIRFVLGLLIVFGAVGGIEQETATLLQGTITAAVGLLLMYWSLPKLVDNM